jgi:hypothetical protein
MKDRASTGTLGVLHVERINRPTFCGYRQRASLPAVGGEPAHPDTFRPIGQVHASMHEHTYAD